MYGNISLLDNALTSTPEESLTIIEGQDVNITCTSTGIPIPTITWTVSNGAVHPQTDLTYDYSIASFGGGSFEINPGMIISYLFIEDLEYLTDDGVEYTCTGSNAYGEDSASSSALITLHVLGMQRHNDAECNLIGNYAIRQFYANRLSISP